MKKLFLILVTILFNSCLLLSQEYDVNLEYTVQKNYGSWKKGQTVRLSTVKHTIAPDGMIEGVFHDVYQLGEKREGSELHYELVKSKFDGAMQCNYRSVQDIWDDNIIASILVMLQKNGTQINLRREMEDDALEYIGKLSSYGLIFNDPFLENYLYTLVSKIAPTTLIDGRPGNVNIIIEKSNVQNAYTFSNGTVVITTGLLSTLHSEDELVAILSHEIAHFVLDHQVQNVNAAVKRQKRAEFWAAVATGITAVAEGYAASKNSYYIPGAATLTMAAIAMEIGQQVIDRLGMTYNQNQEREADELAKQILTILHYDPNALATALSRIWDSYSQERSKAMYFASATHPSLEERIKNAGEPQKKTNSDFEKLVSFAVSSAAQEKYERMRFRQCLPLVNQNIANNVATTDDYLLRANCLMNLSDNSQSNSEAMAAINNAKKLDPNNINIYKTEIIAVLRTKQYQKAMGLLNEYIAELERRSNASNDIKNGNIWAQYYDFINEEKIWSEKMLIKLKGM